MLCAFVFLPTSTASAMPLVDNYLGWIGQLSSSELLWAGEEGQRGGDPVWQGVEQLILSSPGPVYPAPTAGGTR